MSLFKYYPDGTLYPVEEGTIRFTQLGACDDLYEGWTQFVTVGHLSTAESVLIDSSEVAEIWRILPEATRERLPLEEFFVMFCGQREEMVDSAKKIEPDVAGQVSSALYSHREEGSVAELGALDRYLGVLCLAPEGGDVRMWNEYAHNEGFAVEIDEEDPFWSQYNFSPEWLGRFKQVRYVRDRCFRSISDTRFEDIVFTKHISWSHQREWRLVLPLSPGVLNKKGEDGRGYDIWLAEVPPRVIKAVIAGPNTRSGRIEEVKKRLRGAYGHVTLQKAELDRDGTGGHFKIVTIPL